jgi:hypothetical protein
MCEGKSRLEWPRRITVVSNHLISKGSVGGVITVSITELWTSSIILVLQTEHNILEIGSVTILG